LILDNHSAHISKETKAWLADQPVHRFEFTFTPNASRASARLVAQRVEWQLVGFGRDFRRYVVDYGIVDRHISDGDAQRNVDLVLARKWKNASGFEFGVELAAIDGNAWTEDVWSFARRHASRKLTMVRGRGDDGAPRLAQVRRERNPKTGRLLVYSRRFYHLGVSNLKMALYRDLAKDDPPRQWRMAGPLQFLPIPSRGRLNTPLIIFYPRNASLAR
jgi:phage terminase large subunit GpA-like protein